MRKLNSILTITFGTLLGWFLPIVLIKESIMYPDGKYFIFFYEQIAGMLLGFFFGVVAATFIGEKTSLRIFLSKVKQETFSFIGLGLAIVTFTLNVIFPRVIPATFLTQVTPQGQIIVPSETVSMNFSIILGVILLAIIVALIYKLKK